jgi:16S rRNA (cytidine1402-2'-O)-methyltransferase
VVATPIGNLQDLSPRARQVLGEVALVLAEDTRRVRKLLNHIGATTPAKALFEHNEADEVPRLLDLLASGRDLALVSDAGTPLLADPGFRLVRACRQRGFEVLTVAGPSAVAAALAVAGLPPQPFTFAGFLPPRAAARDAALVTLAALGHTLVLFLSPHRLSGELAAMLAELTKVHERFRGGTLAELAGWAASATPRGEYTLVVGPPVTAQVTPDRDTVLAAVAAEQARGRPEAAARRAAARQLGLTRLELAAALSSPSGQPAATGPSPVPRRPPGTQRARRRARPAG